MRLSTQGRKTQITSNPTIFKTSFARDSGKTFQWMGFIKKAKLADAPETFEEVVTTVKTFLEPLAASLAEQRPFRRRWNASGPWR